TYGRHLADRPRPISRDARRSAAEPESRYDSRPRQTPRPRRRVVAHDCPTITPSTRGSDGRASASRTPHALRTPDRPRPRRLALATRRPPARVRRRAPAARRPPARPRARRDPGRTLASEVAEAPGPADRIGPRPRRTTARPGRVVARRLGRRPRSGTPRRHRPVARVRPVDARRGRVRRADPGG